MPPATARALLLPALVALASAWDSRNVSAAEWVCGDAGVVAVTFAAPAGGAPLPIACGTEVLQAPSQVMPDIRVATATVGALYSVIVVDRDASSAANPTHSPIRHMAIGGIPGAALAAGISSNASSATPWFSFSGPQPPAGTGCHRYYVMAYLEDANAPPPTLPDPSLRLNWDFPVWATKNALTKVGVNVWRTQNAVSRTGPCA